MIAELASQLVGQFANNLDAQLMAKSGDTATASDGASDGATTANDTVPVKPAVTAPISGLSLGLRVLWNTIKRFFGSS